MSRRRILLFCFIGFSLYVLFLALTLPAATLFGWVVPAKSSVDLVQVQGTPWSGHASQLQINGMPVGKLTWDIQPWALFAGEIDYNIRVRGKTADITANATVSPGGKMVVTNLHGVLALSTVLSQTPLPLPPHSATGRLKLNIDRFVYDNHRPKVLAGEIQVERLHALWPEPMPLGNYLVKFTTQNDIIHATAHDTGGPIILIAAATLSKKDGRYQAHGTLEPRSKAKPNLKRALHFLGQTDKTGATHFSYSGRSKMYAGQTNKQ